MPMITKGLTLGLTLATVAFASPVFAQSKEQCIQASERGQALREENKLTEAHQQFLVCMNDSCPRPVAEACREDLEQIMKRLPTLVFSARSASGSDLIDVTVQIDGVTVAHKLDGRAIPLDTGPHTIRFEAAGQVVEEQIVVLEGEKSRPVRVTFPGEIETTEPAARGSGLPVATYVLGGVALASLGVFAAFGLSGSSDISDLRDTCGKTSSCAQDDVDDAKTKLLIGDIFLGVAVLSAGAATYFALTNKEAPVSVGLRGPGLQLRGRF